MRIKIQIKSKGDDGWQPINPAEVGGPTLREALSGFAGKMVVAEIDIDGMKYYCCGTHHLQTMMVGRGRSFTTQETGSLLDSINPGILDLPLRVDTVGQIFDGSQLEEISAELPDAEEQQKGLFEG